MELTPEEQTEQHLPEGDATGAGSSAEPTRECPSCGRTVPATKRDCPYCGMIVSRYIEEPQSRPLAAVYAPEAPRAARYSPLDAPDPTRNIVLAAVVTITALVLIGVFAYIQASRARSALQAATTATNDMAGMPAPGVRPSAQPSQPAPIAENRPPVTSRPAGNQAAIQPPFPIWHKVVKLKGSLIDSTAAFDIRGDQWRISYQTRPGPSGGGKFTLSIASSDGGATTVVANTDRAASRDVSMTGAGHYTLTVSALQPHLVMVEDHY